MGSGKSLVTGFHKAAHHDPVAVLLVHFVCHLDWAAPGLDLQASLVVSNAFEIEGHVNGLTILTNLFAVDA